ncbi:hypothetical protein AB0L65_06045 [Nonomuraea sp. NPDC052116]|uniref:hypothetical protein n=1 Tax=Nonomuraea sp. NPDC052116 TaxID=3155665 RepID=UPI0034455A47
MIGTVIGTVNGTENGTVKSRPAGAAFSAFSAGANVTTETGSRTVPSAAVAERNVHATDTRVPSTAGTPRSASATRRYPASPVGTSNEPDLAARPEQPGPAGGSGQIPPEPRRPHAFLLYGVAADRGPEQRERVAGDHA